MTTTEQTTVILKTKYTRKRGNNPESFTSYVISINGGCTYKDGSEIAFPKGTTLPQIKKAYPEYADATVVVMPSHTLKGLTTAKCEELIEATKKVGRTTTPADVVIEKATDEELAVDFAVEPADAIYTVETERPAKEGAARAHHNFGKDISFTEWAKLNKVADKYAEEEQPQADHQEAIHDNSDHARRIAGETPATAHARYELADVKDWATLQEWIAANPKHHLVRKKDGAKAVEFAEYNDGVVCIVLDNKKEAYPYYRVLPRYFDVVPM